MAMSVVITAGISDGSPDAIQKTVTITTPQNVGKGSVSLTASQANKNVPEAFVASTLLAVCMVCDQDCHVYTNNVSGSSPDQTFTLKAGVPFFWQKNSGVTNPVTTDVTTLYVTNDTAVAATFQYQIIKP